MYKIQCIITLLSVSFYSCQSNLEKQLKGGWVVDSAFYNNNPVVWDLYSNGFDLNSDFSCELPIGDRNDRHSDKETGTWLTFSKNGIKVLSIETSNKIFNRTFEITRLTRIRDKESYGYLLKMTLESDSLKLDCTKAIY
jgi:hypothetical protein